MAYFRIARRTPLTPEEAWRRVTDWPRHSAPFTRVDGGERSVLARTRIGPLAFDDPMDVVEWSPPHRCRLEKRGRTVRGWAEIEVAPHPDGGAVVMWRESLRLRGVPRAADPVVAWAGRRVFGRQLDVLLPGAEERRA
ncbi:SRPBCC family protein [Streptomyces triticagri]|uniref:SRPBCC family protein n=1 Tax=Streptomyces triticagri TaxID=2293568 RepID=A0A372MCX9_9ACTN|nr:SRPBCC family protein [Streptomyces triticagri]RFU88243.1 SRPBCC family protein [Streptomyces triticagri]